MMRDRAGDDSSATDPCRDDAGASTVLGMTEWRISTATADRFDDAEHVLDATADGRSCQCQWWTLTNAEYQQADTAGRADLLHTQLASDPAPALIAYVDGEPAGWVRGGPRTDQARLSRTKEFAASVEPWDAPDVWAVSCFVVRKEHRGAGLGSALLSAAVDHARAHGARVVEGYPLDPTTARPSAGKLFRGILTVFERNGFQIVARPQPGRTIVSLTL